MQYACHAGQMDKNTFLGRVEPSRVLANDGTYGIDHKFQQRHVSSKYGLTTSSQLQIQYAISIQYI